ncbi:Uncharacterized protein pbN1_05660 [Aromatoleum bremense]|nr:Uncharacterized protein pbN1_05660 [Aromatoleum bremense]
MKAARPFASMPPDGATGSRLRKRQLRSSPGAGVALLVVIAALALV